MRKLFFYLIILKKIILLRIYPLLGRDTPFCTNTRKSIENYLIFQPSKLRAKRIRRELLKKFTPVRFITPDGIKLYAWFIKPRGKKPVILHLHGQAESILSHQDIAMYCIDKGFGAFMLSYRGHYKSAGKATEDGVYIDAQTAVNQLKKLGVDKDKIILWGHSLGTVVAIETAIKMDLLGIILQSPIKEIKSAAFDIADFYYDRIHLHFLAKFAHKHMEKINFIQTLDGISKIHKVKCPILLLHSKFDKIAPCQNSIALASQNPNSQLFISDEGTHWNADWAFDKVFEFIESLEYNKVKCEK